MNSTDQLAKNRESIAGVDSLSNKSRRTFEKLIIAALCVVLANIIVIFKRGLL